MQQPHRISEEGKWRTLLSCTAGRPIDPDAFPEAFKSQRSARKARRERFLPLKEQPSSFGVETRKGGYHGLENNSYHARTPRQSMETTPFAERVRKAVAPNSPNNSQITRATSTTFSASTANDSLLHHPRHGKSDTQRQPVVPPEPATATTHSTTPSLTISASSSFGEDISFLSFQIDDEDAVSETAMHQFQELEFWRRRASECFDRHGMQHWKTATAFLELGLAHLRCEQYTAAQHFFRTAFRVFEKRFGPRDLRVAKTLEALGMAQSRGSSLSPSSSAPLSPTSSNKAGLLLGLQSFRKCFRIRYDALGPAHIDTVETLNKIANIYMRLQMYSSARSDYLEVLTLRTAILGNQHPSVAVAAQSLGMAHLQRQEHEQAKAYFLQALNVCALSGLQDHPIAQQLREDIKTLGFDLNRVEI